MAKFAFFGAAGAIGRSATETLRSQRVNYRVVGRSQPGLNAAFGGDPLAEIMTWNPQDPASVRRAAHGIETIIYLVGVPYHNFRLHPILMKQTLEGAIAEGVEKIVLVGTVYPYGRPESTRVTEQHPRNPHTFKGQMRKEQEDLLLAADAAGKIRGTILRLPDFYGPNVERSFLYSLFRGAIDRKRANLVGPIDTAHEFMYVPDVGPVLVALANNVDSYGRAWNLAGAGTITQRRFAELVFAHANCKPQFLVVNKMLLRALGLFDPLMRELVEMHYLQTTPVILDDSALRGLLGNVQKTSYEEGIRQTLEIMSRS